MIESTATPNPKVEKSISSVPKGPSQKRQRVAPLVKDTLFSLEREKESLPRKLRTPENIAKLETILRFIAGRKKEGA